MAKKKIDIRQKLRSYQYEFDLLQKVPCTPEENKAYLELLKSGQPLPEGVFRYMYDKTELDEFYTVYKPDLTADEIAEYLTYKKLHMLKTIKNCVVFFTVLTILSLVLVFLSANGAF